MKKRCKHGEIYWYLSFESSGGGINGVPRYRVMSALEQGDAFDHKHWEEGNYYTDPKDAKEDAESLNQKIQQQKRVESRKRKKESIVESEKDVERYLVKQCMNEGWIPLKYSSGISTGYPDRCILIPGGRTVWVEVKTTGQKPTKLQQLRLRQLEQIGFSTRVVDSKAEVDRMISTITEAFLQPQ